MRPGELLAQRFRIERAAGAGAMGTVFRASDLRDPGRQVAVKALPQVASLERFEREVAALASVEHTAVVRYVDHGTSDFGEAFLAMEWIEGQSLAERLAVSSLSGLETVLLGRRLLSGLAALHAAGVIHRDLKPGNVMLGGGRVAEARIVDLGIARVAGEGAAGLTAAGSHLGTPRYMAPEQIRDPHAVDGRADVFSLGCVLFECLTGAPAFPGEESMSVLAQVLFGHTPELSEHRPELPDELEQLLERLLSRSRRLRPFASPQLMAEFDVLLAPPRRSLLEAVPARSPTPGSRRRHDARTQASETGQSRERPSFALLVRRPTDSIRRASPPLALGPWVGRDLELSEICALLARERLVALWGGAGVGKTRLALEAMRVLERLHPERTALFCELGEARDSADVVRVVSERAGLSLAAHAQPELVLGSLLGKFGQVLLVLDRCEHLSTEVEPLLSLWADSAPGLHVLATSRARLRWISAFELRPLATRAELLPQPGLEPPLSAAGALVLAMSKHALGSPERLGESAEARECAERIASALDGNPLAIELAAARVPVLGLSGVVARLPAQLALLSDHSQTQTMRAAIAWSWGLLSEAERQALMQCAVFRGSFTLAAAEQVLVSERPVLELIQALREQSLLLSTAHAGRAELAVRLTMSAALREFAHTQLAMAREQRPELAELGARHCRYYTELARGWQSTTSAERSVGRQEHDNLVAAAEHALAQPEPRAAGNLVLALQPALLGAGGTGPLLALLERVLAVADAAPAEPELARLSARLHGLHARLLAPTGEFARAKQELERARLVATSSGDHGLCGVVLLDFGVALHFARELEAAAECYEAALEHLAHVDNLSAEGRCQGNLGALAHDQGRLEEAARGYRYAIALLEEAEELRLLANYRGNLALIEHELGRPESARDLYAQAVTGLEELCDARLLGIVLGNAATLELASDQTARALPLLVRALALLEGCADRRSLGLAMGRLAVGFALSGKLEDAESQLLRAERQLRRGALTRALAACFRGFVELARAERLAQTDPAGAMRELLLVRARREALESEQHAGRSIRQQSDDFRLYCALFDQKWERARQALESTSEAAGSGQGTCR